MFRGIPELVFEDVPKGHEQWLRWGINGEYPSDPLPVLYDALVAGAAHLDVCRDDLWEAREAMDDVEGSQRTAFKVNSDSISPSQVLIHNRASITKRVAIRGTYKVDSSEKSAQQVILLKL